MERKYDWKHIKDLQVIDWIPDHYDIDEEVLFRSPLLLINHLFWNQLVDYKFYNQINSTGDPIITVHGYYISSICKLRRVKVVEIPANEEFKQTITIKNESPLRQNSIKQARLENCLDFNSSTLKFYIESNFGINDLNEYCSPELEIIEIKGDHSITPYDRVWVGWAIELVVGIYREDTEGNISLVGCNDYLFDFVPMIYPKSNNYWTKRIKEESVRNSHRFIFNRSKMVVRPKGISQDDPNYEALEQEEFDTWKELEKQSHEKNSELS